MVKNNVKTTVIEKKNKATGRVTRINYAKAVDRINAFWENNPKGKIETEHKYDNGNIVFKAYVWRDKSDYIDLVKSGVDIRAAFSSCDATGTSEYARDDEKKYEKLETLSIARALAIMGYAASGEIASSEEMEIYDEFKREQLEAQLSEILVKISGAKTLEDLKNIWVAQIPPKFRTVEKVILAKNSRKNELSKKNKGENED